MMDGVIMEPTKAKELISTLFSVRIHEKLFDSVDKCVGKSRWEINNILKSDMKDELTEFGQGWLAGVVFILVGDGQNVEGQERGNGD